MVSSPKLGQQRQQRQRPARGAFLLYLAKTLISNQSTPQGQPNVRTLPPVGVGGIMVLTPPFRPPPAPSPPHFTIGLTFLSSFLYTHVRTLQK